MLWQSIGSIFLPVLFSSISCSIDCPDNWVDAANRCFLFNNAQRLSWMNSQLYCQSLGGHLAEPITEDWTNLLTSIAKIETDVLGVEAWWLGLSDLGHEGRWIWQNALQEADFTNWADGSPIDSGIENNCVSMRAENDLRWNDEPCTNSRASPICEREYIIANLSVTTNEPPTTTAVNIITDGPYGDGLGGSQFNDYLTWFFNGDITNIQIREGTWVNSIRMRYGNEWTDVHGSEGGTIQEFALSEGEHIVEIQGKAGALIDQITFVTDLGQTIGPIGGDSGASFATSYPGCYLAHLSGRAGENIDRLYFHWQC